MTVTIVVAYNSRTRYNDDIKFCVYAHTSSDYSLCLNKYECTIDQQGWGPRGLASTSRTPRGQNFVALALASTMRGLDFGFEI